jgi:hypothetical protein
MTYGFEAYNSSGEKVIGDEYPLFVLSEEKTITGTNPDSSGNYKFPYPNTGQVRFWKLDPGDGISAWPNGFIGSKQTFTIRDTIPVSSAPAPTGYGLVVFNALGHKVFSATSETLPIGDKYEVTPGGSSISLSDQWVSICEWSVSMIPSGTGLNGFSISGGCRRKSSTEYESFAVIFSSAPVVTRLNPTTFITMKG